MAPIAAQAAALHVFQRTANWVLPRLDRRYTAHDRLLAANPVYARVCATGFDTVHLLSSLEVRGSGGRTLRQAWSDGPEAYHGLTVSGFPNLFLRLGPNTGTGRTSTLLFIEPQVDYVIACLQEPRRNGRRWLDLRPEVMAAHNRALQARLQGSVWAHCRSWYRMESGKVVALFPGFSSEYVESIAQPDFRDCRFG